jgi:hypothetical protein
MHTELLEKLINPPRHSGNGLYKHLTEEDQLNILQFAKETTLQKAAREYSVSEDRVKRIFTKFSEELPAHTAKKPKGQRLPASAKAMLEKLTETDFKGRLPVYSYMGQTRTVTGYSVDDEMEEHILIIHTLTTAGIKRDVRYYFRDATTLQQDFVRWEG